jgi:hypothetical protein
MVTNDPTSRFLGYVGAVGAQTAKVERARLVASRDQHRRSGSSQL